MERKVRHGPPFVHKRQGSGSNDTTILGPASKESSSKTATTISTSQASTELSPIKPSTVTEPKSVKSATLPSSTKVREEPPSTITTSSKVTSVSETKTPSTPVAPTSNAAANVDPAPLPIVNATPSAGPQLIAAPAATNEPNPPNPPAPVASSSTSAVVASSDTLPPTIIIDTAMKTAQSTSIPAPTFEPVTTSVSGSIQNIQSLAAGISTTTGAPSNVNTIQSQFASDTTSISGLAPTGVAANGQASTQLTDSSAPTTQTSNSTTIIGATVGSIAAFVLLAMIGIWCIRRRYRNTTVIMSPFSKRSSSDRMPLSPPPLEYFKPDVKTLFIGGRTSSEESSRASTPSSLPPPPYRHSRSYTTTVLPPAIPARSSARPLLDRSPITATTPAAHLGPPRLSQPMASIDTSFMGTISQYFSSDNNPKSDSMAADSHLSSNISSTESQYSTSPYTSYLASEHPPLPTSNPLLPATTSSTSAKRDSATLPHRTNTYLSTSTSTSASSATTSASNPSPSQTTIPQASWREPTTPGGLLSTSRYQSMGQWRDSVWSTTATPIFNSSSSSSGTPSPFYTRPGSAHRVSRSMGDVLDWRAENGGRASGVIPPPPLVVIDHYNRGGDEMDVPPRSPLRAWPLR